MKFNNNEITKLYYSGHTIIRAYGCDGNLVFGEAPYVPPFTDKVKYVLNDYERTIPCNTSSTLTRVEIQQDMITNGDGNLRTREVLNVVIGECVNTIENSCFNEYNSVTSITIPSSVTTIGAQAFYNCHVLPTLIIPNGVTVISSNLFGGDYMLSNTNIPNGITTIENNAYFDCLSLMDITIPSSVTSIGDEAFRADNWADDAEKRSMMRNMAQNRVVRCLATTPPTLGDAVFSIIDGSNDIATYKIYVPQESLEAYKSATNWSYYADRIMAIQ